MERCRTADVQERERADYWRDAVCDAYVRLGCVFDAKRQFNGAIDIRRHRTIDISSVRGSQHQVMRRQKDIARSNNRDFLLSLQSNRTALVEQNGHMAALRPRDFAIYSSTNPYRLSLSEGFEQTVLQFPKHELLARLPDAEGLTGLRVDGDTALGRLVAENIATLTRMLGSQPAETQYLMQAGLLDLIAAALAGLRDSRYTLSSPAQHYWLRAKSVIRENLHNPELNRSFVAARLGLSVRRLSEIFTTANETVAGQIRECRLCRCADMLKDPRFDRQSISEIAYQCGFNNIPNFSRCFRQRFGRSPRNYRLSRDHLAD